VRASAKLAPSPAPPTPPHDETNPLDLDSVLRVWQNGTWLDELNKRVGARIFVHLSQLRPTAVAPPNVVVIGLGAGYNSVADKLDTPEVRTKIEQALQKHLQRPVTVRFERSTADDSAESHTDTASTRLDGLAGDPMVQQVVELFQAQPVQVEFEDDTPRSVLP
jgi:hypothetical protein